MSESILVLGYGNPSRGDDAVGVLLLDWLQQQAIPNVAFVSDFQLQIEHALDLQHRELVLFADASLSCSPPFSLTQLAPAQDDSYTSHAMSPTAVLHTYQTILNQPPPPSFLLSIAACEFELGAELSSSAQQHLQRACAFAALLLKSPCLETWLTHC